MMARCLPASRFRLNNSILAALLFTLAPSLSFAINDNLTKGATNNHVFESGIWGESIDTLNGGLNLRIPIGPTYGVSADVSYQLKLAYSSKIWQIEDNGSYYSGSLHYRTRSRLQGRGQAGLGFMLQLGRGYERANSVECATNSYDSGSRMTESVFEDATGAAHPASTGRGSPDGSLMRVWSNQVTMPGGTRYVLGHHVDDLIVPNDARWPRCTATFPAATNAPKATFDIQTNDYRGEYVTLIEGKDGPGVNHVEIVYEVDAGMKHLMHKITNVRNGVPDTDHKITFINSKAHPTDPTLPDLEMGYLKSVTVPVFSPDPAVIKKATYTFNYTLVTVYDPYVATAYTSNGPYYAADNPSSWYQNTLLLTSIEFPGKADGETPVQTYTMTFEYTEAGYMKARVLPTGARVEYDLLDYPITPLSCQPVAGMYVCANKFAGMTMGISAKRVILEPGQVSTWFYVRYATGKPNPERVVVTDPSGNDTVTYFHADNIDTSNACPFGFGSTGCNQPRIEIWKNGRPYKTEYYAGTSSNPGNLIRSEDRSGRTM